MGLTLRFQLGYDIINSYKRLAYTPWHALAEFVDNSTQSYFNNTRALDEAFRATRETLRVSIVYDRNEAGGYIRISDNAMGMSYDELVAALHIGHKPVNPKGRSQYGLGMKTSSCWLGERWSIRTKKLGETTEHNVAIDVKTVTEGQDALPYHSTERPANQHYTIIEITKLNREFHGRTLSKIKDFLSSMYREDIKNGTLVLDWMNAPLSWDDLDSELLTAADGSLYKKAFEFEVRGKAVRGWVGILRKGSRSKAGFSILRYNRVIQGWPDAWRPQIIFGQFLGSNDLINQRIVGEIHLDDFLVSHTKDEILWLGDEDELVEAELEKYSRDFVHVAKTHRKTADGRGPTEAETKVALESFTTELHSPEMVDKITLETASVDLSPAVRLSVVQAVQGHPAAFTAKFKSGLELRGYLEALSYNDPYVTNDIGKNGALLVIINTNHPHWTQLKGSEGVLNYLRHCTYDAVAEWQVSKIQQGIDPNTVKLFKDKLLRVALEIEMHGGNA